MSDEISVPVSLPLDDDGFLRRECPTCEGQFKWFSHDADDPDAEVVDQYHCPLCGVASDLDSWWTPEQLAYAEGVAGPELDRMVQDSMRDAFKGIGGVTFERDSSFTLGIPSPQPLHDDNDMVTVEPPCHPNEPLKVPEDTASAVHCLICGSRFAA